MFMYDTKEVRREIKAFYNQHQDDDKYDVLSYFPHMDPYLEDTDRYIWFMCGLPASGKSTKAEFIAHEADKTIILSRDKYRAYLREVFNCTDYFPTNAKIERDLWASFVTSMTVAHSDFDFIIDQTSLNDDTIEFIVNHIKEGLKKKDETLLQSTKFGLILMATPLDVCLEHNKERTGFEHVPEETIKNMEPQFLRLYYNHMLRGYMPSDKRPYAEIMCFAN